MVSLGKYEANEATNLSKKSKYVLNDRLHEELLTRECEQELVLIGKD